MNRSPNNPTAPKVALLGPLPPPYGGYASYVVLLRESALGERFGYHIIDTSHARLGGGRSKAFGLAHLAVRDVWRFWRATRIRSIRLIHIPGAFYPQRRFLLQAALFRWAGRKGWNRIYDIRAGRFMEFADTAPRRVQRQLDEMILGADAVTVEGRPYVNYIRDRWGVEALYMPNFISWDETGARYRADAGGAAPLRVVFTGRLHEAKGVVDLAEAVAKIAQRVPVRLDLIGPPEEGADRKIRAIIEQHGLQDVIVLHGGMPKAQLLELAAKGHVYAMPTFHVTEGHSNALTEAMAMGLPVVTCDQGFCADVVSGGAGVLVPQRDTDALAKVLEELAGDPERRRRIGEAARKRAREHFSDEVMLPRWADLYERLIGAKA